MDGRELTELYKIRFEKDQLQRKNDIWKVLCSGFFQRFVKPADSILDVACGYGEFTNNIIAGRKIAIDLNADAKAFLNADVEFYQCEAERISSLNLGGVDLIFTSNFLEHLPDKHALDIFLDQVLQTLKPGGKYVIMGPNLRYLPGTYWDFYDHHLGLTHLSLCEALNLRGFEIELCLDRFLPYTTKGALPTHPWLVQLYLRVPWIWRVLGKQFLIVARKPSGELRG